MSSPKSEMKFVAEIEMLCRCGQKVLFGEADGVPSGMHADPYCEAFAKKVLIEYMQWLRSDA